MTSSLFTCTRRVFEHGPKRSRPRTTRVCVAQAAQHPHHHHPCPTPSAGVQFVTKSSAEPLPHVTHRAARPQRGPAADTRGLLLPARRAQSLAGVLPKACAAATPARTARRGAVGSEAPARFARRHKTAPCVVTNSHHTTGGAAAPAGGAMAPPRGRSRRDPSTN